MPLNLVYLPAVRRLFPRSRVIVALRDPRDCCLSCFMQVFGPNTWMRHFHSLERAAALYADVMSLWLLYRDRLGLEWTEIRYEDVVADVETQARRLIDFLGLEWTDDVLDYRAKAEAKYISTPSYSAVRKPVYSTSVRRWERYRDQIEPIQPMLRAFVHEFGYQP